MRRGATVPLLLKLKEPGAMDGAIDAGVVYNVGRLGGTRRRSLDRIVSGCFRAM